MELKSDEELNALRAKYLIHKRCSGYGIYKGYTLPKVFEKYDKNWDEFDVFEDDIWVISGPKCGTTWLQEMVWCIGNNFNIDGATEDLDSRFPFFELDCLSESGSGNVISRNIIKRPRFLKSHLPWDLLPRQLREFEKRPKIVYVARDPKDVCISYYHHHELFLNFKGGFELFWQLFVNGKVSYTPILENILTYWKRRNEPNILFLKYEDMKADLPGVIKKVSTFLSVNATENDVKELAKHLSFDEMRKNPATNRDNLVDISRKEGMCSNPDGHFIRRGVAGAYKTEMSPEVVEYFDNWYKKSMDGTGLIF